MEINSLTIYEKLKEYCEFLFHLKESLRNNHNDVTYYELYKELYKEKNYNDFILMIEIQNFYISLLILSYLKESCIKYVDDNKVKGSKYLSKLNETFNVRENLNYIRNALCHSDSLNKLYKLEYSEKGLIVKVALKEPGFNIELSNEELFDIGTIYNKISMKNGVFTNIDEIETVSFEDISKLKIFEVNLNLLSKKQNAEIEMINTSRELLDYLIKNKIKYKEHKLSDDETYAILEKILKSGNYTYEYLRYLVYTNSIIANYKVLELSNLYYINDLIIRNNYNINETEDVFMIDSYKDYLRINQILESEEFFSDINKHYNYSIIMLIVYLCSVINDGNRKIELNGESYNINNIRNSIIHGRYKLTDNLLILYDGKKEIKKIGIFEINELYKKLNEVVLNNDEIIQKIKKHLH